MVSEGSSKLVQIFTLNTGTRFTRRLLRTTYKTLTSTTGYTNRKIISTKKFKGCNAIKFKFTKEKGSTPIYTYGILVAKGTKLSYLFLMSSSAYQPVEFNKILKTFKFR